MVHNSIFDVLNLVCVLGVVDLLLPFHFIAPWKKNAFCSQEDLHM